MLWRFSLYGFLKNQRYFEPFLIVILRERGLSFTELGFLFAGRELFVNLFEIPSGAIADLYGRRRAMVASFASYCISFVVLAQAMTFAVLSLGMFLFAIGEAFRSGTHKSMIFAWLRQQGREAERAKVYGKTRSWSKLGSALSAIIAVLLVFSTGQIEYVFWFTLAPYLLNLINLASYPRWLDETNTHRHERRPWSQHLHDVYHHTRQSIRQIWKTLALRRLFLASMTYEGLYAASKDYIQPIITAFVATYVLHSTWTEDQQNAVALGTVYFLIHLAGSFASRHAHRFADDKAPQRGILRLWIGLFGVGGLLLVSTSAFWAIGIVVAFVLWAALQNLWRPVVLARFDAVATPEQGATLLSVESQGKAWTTMILSAIIGITIDAALTEQQNAHEDLTAFLPIAWLVLSLSAFFLLVDLCFRNPTPSTIPDYHP